MICQLEASTPSGKLFSYVNEAGGTDLDCWTVGLLNSYSWYIQPQILDTKF